MAESLGELSISTRIVRWSGPVSDQEFIKLAERALELLSNRYKRMLYESRTMAASHMVQTKKIRKSWMMYKGLNHGYSETIIVGFIRQSLCSQRCM